MIKLNGIEIKPTVFPDGTSQVWQLGDYELNLNSSNIEFDFEHEAECMHLFQLLTLLQEMKRDITLIMRYLPYARQDKPINNQSTFALRTFIDLLSNYNISSIKVLDVHSDEMFSLVKNFAYTTNMEPDQYIRQAFMESGANTIGYPDKGAEGRYFSGNYVPTIIGHKSRNQETGYIEDYYIEGNPKGRDVLIVDDICDGGMTFKLMAKELYKQGAKNVHLYVTHGIFSKGLTTLRDSGIKRVFTYKGEVDKFCEPPKGLSDTELHNV